MHAFDALDVEQPPSKPKNSSRKWNILTALMLVMTVCVGGATWHLFTNPNSVFNPFPPPTLPAALQFPTATATPLVNLPPTWTPTLTPEPSATPTPRPTSTPLPTETPFYLTTPETEPEVETTRETPSGSMPFVLHNNRTIVIENIYHVDAGCEWTGVGGQIFDRQGGPVHSQIVTLGGRINGKSIPGSVMTTLSGLVPDAPANYYEFQLSEAPFDSKGELWVQLVDQNLVPVSDKIYFDTFNDCQKNLIIINFQQIK